MNQPAAQRIAAAGRFSQLNRTHKSVSKTSSDPETTTWMTYDASGNLAAIRVESKKFGMDEVTYYDADYNTTLKDIPKKASWVKKAKYLYGKAYFTYDPTGQLVYLDRGKPKGDKYNALGMYTYDNEGKILTRADKASAEAVVGAVCCPHVRKHPADDQSADFLALRVRKVPPNA